MIGSKVKVVKWRGDTAEVLYEGKILEVILDKVKVAVTKKSPRGFKRGDVKVEHYGNVIVLNAAICTHTVARCPQCGFVFPSRVEVGPKFDTSEGEGVPDGS